MKKPGHLPGFFYCHHLTRARSSILVGDLDHVEICTHGPESCQNRGIEMHRFRAPVSVKDDTTYFCMVKGVLVDPAASQGIILVDQHDYPPLQRGVFPFQTVRI